MAVTMTTYNRNPAMVEKDKNFRCYNCGHLLVKHVEGHYIMRLNCRHCKAEINVKCVEAIPVSLEHN